MRIARVVSFIVAFSMIGAGFALAKKQPDSGKGLRLHHDLPRDPLVVLATSTDDLASRLAAARGWAFEVTSEDTAADAATPLADLERRLGSTLERLIEAHIGPEIALSLELPPIDFAATAIQQSNATGLSILLARAGVLTGVRDVGGLRRTLDSLFDGMTSAEEDGVVRVEFSLGSAAPSGAEGQTVSLFYAIRRDRLAVGFSAEWVLECLDERPVEQRLPGGEDFGNVFAQLDQTPTSLTYVNLPRLRQLAAESQIVQAMMVGSDEIAGYLRPLLSDEIMSTGIGSTSVSVQGGVRTTNFGPQWMSGTAISGGLLAAMTIPGMIGAAEGHRGRRTLRDIESIAVACEGFSEDSRSYPPSEGWVPVEEVAVFLEPVYIATLPLTDAWNNPILYWSDGMHYRIISTGGDGQMDQDWLSVSEPMRSTRAEGDIVYGDGQLLVVAAQLVEN